MALVSDQGVRTACGGANVREMLRHFVVLAAGGANNSMDHQDLKILQSLRAPIFREPGGHLAHVSALGILVQTREFG